MKIAEILLTLRQRGNGKTTLQQVGTKNYDRKFLFVCKNRMLGEFETGKNPNAIYITVDNLEKLQGYDLPIAISHTVVEQIIQDSLGSHRIIQRATELIKNG